MNIATVSDSFVELAQAGSPEDFYQQADRLLLALELAGEISRAECQAMLGIEQPGLLVIYLRGQGNDVKVERRKMRDIDGQMRFMSVYTLA